MAMKFWTVKKGNKSVRDILIKDKEGNVVDNLAIATAIKFQIKKNKTDAALVEKTKDDGIEVLAGDDLGKLRITLLPVDTGTTLGKGEFFMGLQIKWSAEDIYEVVIKIDGIKSENFIVKQDIVQ